MARTRLVVASIVTAALAALTLAGCSSSGSSAAAGATPVPVSTSVIHEGSLVGTWVIDQRFDSPEQPFVAFVQDNTWVASDGCNRVQGTWQVDDNGMLTTTSGPQTLMACDGAQLPLAVTEGTHVSVNGDYLTIDSSFGTTSTELVRSTDPTVGPQGRPIGYWTQTRLPTSPFLSLDADGTYSGSDGCNRLAGSWVSPFEGSVVFTAGISTLMACDGVNTWLAGAATGTIKAGVMTVQSVDGQTIGQLKSF